MEDKIPVCPREGRGSNLANAVDEIGMDSPLQSPRGARIASQRKLQKFWRQLSCSPREGRGSHLGMTMMSLLAYNGCSPREGRGSNQ